MIIRKIKDSDLDTIVKINNQHSEWVGKKDREFFERHLQIPFFNVVEKYVVNGFIIVLNQDVNYDSPNFLWFKERFKEFYYIDRIVIAKDSRYKGLGTFLYKNLLNNVGKVPLLSAIYNLIASAMAVTSCQRCASRA